MTVEPTKIIEAARHCARGGECSRECPISQEDACLQCFRDALLEMDKELRARTKELQSLRMHIEHMHIETTRWSSSVLRIARQCGEAERRKE